MFISNVGNVAILTKESTNDEKYEIGKEIYQWSLMLMQMRRCKGRFSGQLVI